MPSASAETIDEVGRFLDSVDDYHASNYLMDAGYTLSPSWEWRKPGVKCYEDMTREEFACLLYLCHEWDYGTLER